ncbi:AbrB/MazE/SpoVT family DNA-binding domain-containing protein [Dyella sp. Tek66A03]|uniref:AbrB/MazE/SpoVT family DNA-binding domain-containing protein n=1 Tax=Dyella sp. Tek66A03 TaxID=3458298 RepID=UPI00403E6039
MLLRLPFNASIDNVDTECRTLWPGLCGTETDGDLQAGERIVQVIVKKWGNSAAVRIPSAVLAAAKLQVDAKVDVREEGGRIVIEPIVPSEIDLDVLLSCITPDNIHGEVSFGTPVGREAL